MNRNQITKVTIQLIFPKLDVRQHSHSHALRLCKNSDVRPKIRKNVGWAEVRGPTINSLRALCAGPRASAQPTQNSCTVSPRGNAVPGGAAPREHFVRFFEATSSNPWRSASPLHSHAERLCKNLCHWPKIHVGRQSFAGKPATEPHRTPLSARGCRPTVCESILAQSQRVGTRNPATPHRPREEK